LKRKRKGRFQVFRSAFCGTLGFAQFGGKFFSLTTRLRGVPKPLWNKDFSGNPEKSEVTSWAEEFGKILQEFSS
jgi:hypothetical protein